MSYCNGILVASFKCARETVPTVDYIFITLSPRSFDVKIQIEIQTVTLSSRLVLKLIPQVPQVERLLILCCRVENFYPQDISLEWSRNDGEEVGSVSYFGPFSGQNRLYSVWSKIQLGSEFSCRVVHSAQREPEERLYTLPHLSLTPGC
uniref:Ig-like domain-containing protein n=1 Tax=Mastacembelus armatus TaxID=205130 RepID=A0A3Q3KUS1_9TELE